MRSSWPPRSHRVDSSTPGMILEPLNSYKHRNTKKKYLFASLSILPVLVTQGSEAPFLCLYTFALLEGLAESTSTDLAVLVEPIKSSINTVIM